MSEARNGPSPVIWIDGEWRTKETATVSVYDHGLLYGDGIFEGMRIYGGRVFRLEDHLVRLEESARALLLPLPYGRDQIEALGDLDRTLGGEEADGGHGSVRRGSRRSSAS